MIKQYTKNNKKYYMVNNLYLGVNPFTGKEVRKTKRGFESKKEAEIYSAQLKVEFEKGTMFVSNKKHTFSAVYDIWVENYKHTVKESSYKKALDYCKKILAIYGNADIKKISMLDCQKIVNEWGEKYSAKYLNNLYIYSSLIFKYAVQMNIINSSPMDKVKKPRVQKKKKEEIELYYTKDELLHFLDITKTNYDTGTYMVFRLLAFTGARIGEVLALNWQDIDFNKGTVNINKTLAVGLDNKVIIQDPKTLDSNRVITIDPITLQELRTYKLEQKELLFKLGKQNKGILFPNSKNAYYNSTCFNYRLNQICSKYNIKKIKIHGFRHTHCSLLFEAEATIQEVQYRLGHSDIQTTMNIYNHVTEKVQEKTADKFAKFMQSV